MYCGWRCAVGQAGVGANGLKLVGGPHWKPAMNRVSPAAPARPWASPPWLRPVWAVPQPVAPTPINVPPTAMAERLRKRRRLVWAPATRLGSDGSLRLVWLVDGSSITYSYAC